MGDTDTTPQRSRLEVFVAPAQTRLALQTPPVQRRCRGNASCLSTLHGHPYVLTHVQRTAWTTPTCAASASRRVSARWAIDVPCTSVQKPAMYVLRDVCEFYLKSRRYLSRYFCLLLLRLLPPLPPPSRVPLPLVLGVLGGEEENA